LQLFFYICKSIGEKKGLEVNEMLSHIDYVSLLNAYRSIWNNRSLTAEIGHEENTLKEAILRELKDENSHPCVRRVPAEKYVLATERTIESSIKDEEKVLLIKLHLDAVEELKKM
jgi:hypothetical protein